MNNEDNQDREAALRERIVSLIRANAQARRTSIGNEELEKLKTAASRLDQMLKAAEDAEAQALRKAAAKLGQLLIDIRKGRDLPDGIKRRQGLNREGD